MITITKDKQLVSNFIDHMGESRKTFRYFNKRNVSSIDNHLLTCLYQIDGVDFPVGYSHVDIDGRFWFGICVSEGYTGNGIGKALMEFTLSEFDKRIVNQNLYLTVDKNNLSAILMYKKFGFEVEKEYEIKMEVGTWDFIRMIRKSLN